MTLHSLDDVVDNHIGREFICRRTLMENLRPGRKYDYVRYRTARKVGNRWAFTDDDIERLLDRMCDGGSQDLDTAQGEEPAAPVRLPSGISPRSPRARGRLSALASP
ncbi:hypothetical protein EF294_07370 [Gordonia oryzae]|uniref:Uncharacterized protein n=1 Tax=Gordonia oryzae TaxID=2487349 RepID=A0A3N4HES6_9ACTN|nr:hypothetical protein [Gordonia oryzae]RPA64894.1 hypothetical protein EF294_07370 [Gordonia oryzae]